MFFPQSTRTKKTSDLSTLTKKFPKIFPVERMRRGAAPAKKKKKIPPNLPRLGAKNARPTGRARGGTGSQWPVLRCAGRLWPVDAARPALLTAEP